MHRAYKYRLYPTDEQSAMLNAWFAAVRLVYNEALEQRNIYGRSISKDGPDYWGGQQVLIGEVKRQSCFINRRAI